MLSRSRAKHLAARSFAFREKTRTRILSSAASALAVHLKDTRSAAIALCFASTVSLFSCQTNGRCCSTQPSHAFIAQCDVISFVAHLIPPPLLAALRGDIHRARGVVQATVGQHCFMSRRMAHRLCPLMLFPISRSFSVPDSCRAAAARARVLAPPVQSACKYFPTCNGNGLPFILSLCSFACTSARSQPKRATEEMLRTSHWNSNCLHSSTSNILRKQCANYLFQIKCKSRSTTQWPVNFLPCKYRILQLGSSILTMSTAFGPIAGQSRTSTDTSLLRAGRNQNE